MRFLFLVLAIFLVVSCSGRVGIKTIDAEMDIKEASIKTTKVEIHEDAEETINPSLRILYPEEGRLVKNSSIAVRLEAYNFSIVPVGRQAKNYEGHFHVWVDSEKKIVAENSVIFENVASGKHNLTVELVKSNHSSLSPKAAKSLIFDVEIPAAEKINAPQEKFSGGYLREYTIEADDNDFYPNKIRASVGDNVTIRFKFRDHLIYYYGLDVIGPFPDVNYRTGDVQPIDRSFAMREETKIKSFWPSSGVKKAELTVEVEK